MGCIGLSRAGYSTLPTPSSVVCECRLVLELRVIPHVRDGHVDLLHSELVTREVYRSTKLHQYLYGERNLLALVDDRPG